MKPPTPYVINIDRLIISFEIDTNNFQTNLRNSKTFLYTLSPKNKYNRDYKESYTISHSVTKEHLFYIDIGFRFLSGYNRIRVVNKTLYSPNFQTLLNTLVSTYNLLNPVVRYIDICIDTNQPLLKRYNNKYQSLKPITNYCFDYYGNEDERVLNGIDNETKYIKKRKQTQVCNDRLMRIENKSREIVDSNFQKLYILHNLKRKGLDVDKRVERIELRLNYKVFKTKNLCYINKHTGKEISKTKWNSLPVDKVLKDIWETPIRNYKSDYIRKVKTCYLNIDIYQLSNPNYLLSLFEKYSVFNHSKLITLSYNLLNIRKSVVINDVKTTNEVRTIDNEDLIEQQIEIIKQRMREDERRLSELLGSELFINESPFDFD